MMYTRTQCVPALGAAVMILLSTPATSWAQNDREVGRALGNIIFGIIGGTFGRERARSSWARIPGTMRVCLSDQHGIIVNDLINQGVTAEDRRLAPYMQDCRQFVAAQQELTRQAQQHLAELGYDPGPVDGLPGARTNAAIERFQRDQNLPVSGQVSNQLVEQLRREALRIREQDNRLAGQDRTEPDSTDRSTQAVTVPAAPRRAPQQTETTSFQPDPGPSAAERAAQARRERIVALHGDEFVDEILEGRIVVGMTKEHAFAARGEPSRKDTIPPDDELWYYGNERVTLYKNKVTYVGP
ncbi:MAG: peptidoglycan-binding protein [Rhizobiaceae bacterium]|nr:peptidoglycan-binding protein [Rhizobiaceae bacterium]